MLYQEALYGEELYYRDIIYGYRIIAHPVNFDIGMGAFITAHLTANIPPETKVIIEISTDNGATWTRLKPEEEVYFHIDTTTGGDKDITVKIQLETNNPMIKPEIDRLEIEVRQVATAYRLAYEVLTDAGLTPEEYFIDPELLEFYIPNAWLRRGSHAAGLKQIVKFILGQCYTDRKNIIRIDGPGYTPDPNPAQSIGPNIYKSKKPIHPNILPVNQVTVYANPLTPSGQAVEVYRSNNPIAIKAGEQIELTAYFTAPNNLYPAVNCTAELEGAPAGVSVLNQIYYAWGGKITVTSTVDGYFVPVIKGYPLQVVGRLTEMMTGNNTRSMNFDGILYGEYLYGETLYEAQTPVNENNITTFTLPSYHLIQSREIARKLAGILLSKFPEAPCKYALEYRGNPALTLDDIIALGSLRGPEVRNHVIKVHELIYDGALKGRMEVK